MSTRYNSGSHYENHPQAAELHDVAAHAHTVAEQREDRDHLTGHELSRRALEHAQSTQQHPDEQRIPIFGHEDIAVLAHELWKARGCPNGSPQEDWFEAAKRLRARAERPAGGAVG